MKLVRELRTADFDARADTIDDIINVMAAPRTDQRMLIVRHLAERA